MKSFKRALSLVLLLVMMVSILVIPASAASFAMVSRFRGFRQTSTGNYISGYASAAQSFLLGYSGTSSIIANSGGVDGMFGAKTAEAAAIFQRNQGLADDGIIGPDTWGAMGSYLSESTSGSTTTFRVGGRSAISAVYSSSTYNFYYHNTSGSRSGLFHTSY